MTNETSRDRRFMIFKNLILLLVFIVIVVLAIWAWFTMNREVNASGISITSSAADDVQIARANSDGTIEGEFANQLTISDDFQFLTDCTGEGVNFIIPAFSITQNAADGKLVNLNGIPEDAVTSKEIVDDKQTYQVLSIDFLLRSKKQNVSVKTESYLAGLCEAADAKPLTNTDDGRKSSYGNFSADTLVQAMRVSLVGKPVHHISNSIYYTSTNSHDTGNNRQFLWIPRSDYQLLANTDNLTNWTIQNVVADIATLAPAQYPSTYKHDYYTKRVSNNVVDGVTKNTMLPGEDLSISAINSKTFTKNGNTLTIPTLRAKKCITNYASGSEASAITMDGTPYYIYKYTMNIWIEGSDSEARRAMNEGKFQLHMEFGNS